jgi:hypothetical protein
MFIDKNKLQLPKKFLENSQKIITVTKRFANQNLNIKINRIIIDDSILDENQTCGSLFKEMKSPTILLYNIFYHFPNNYKEIIIKTVLHECRHVWQKTNLNTNDLTNLSDIEKDAEKYSIDNYEKVLELLK